MKTDHNEFFRKITLSICGNLDMETALYETFLALKRYIPLDAMYIELYEAEMNCMRVIGKASEKGGESLELVIPLPEQAKQETKNAREKVTSAPEEAAFFENDPEKNEVASYLLNFLGLPASSVLGLPLVIEGEPFGAIILIAEGTGNYTEEHKQLLVMLREPFYIALSNTLKHLNILQLKDLLADDNRFLHRELHRKAGDNIIGADFGLRNVLEMVRQVASMNSPVLLLGETGVGKDVIANAIHQLSDRRVKPFIAVNCGGIPENLVDSELFGHEKGAFTGALSQKRGRFERADKGTIFLDEIGELPLQAQVRLLRVLQDRIIERVGSDKSIQLDIRIIAATNRNLQEMVQQGSFREDLWFRLNVFPITIPPLRQRLSDIPALVHHFILHKSRELKLTSIPTVAKGALETLTNYTWPGNVRELQNVVERALIINPKGPVNFEHMNQSWQDEPQPISQIDYASEKLDDVIINHIQRILQETNGKVHGPDGAAKRLGLNASTLRNKMNKLGIQYGKKAK